MTILDLDQLDTVTGGGAQPAQGGGNPLAGLDQILGFFQSEGFQQFIGGLRQLLGQFGSPAAQPPQQQEQQQQPQQQQATGGE